MGSTCSGMDGDEDEGEDGDGLRGYPILRRRSRVSLHVAHASMALRMPMMIVRTPIMGFMRLSTERRRVRIGAL